MTSTATLRPIRWRGLAGVLVALGLVAAGCGSDDDTPQATADAAAADADDGSASGFDADRCAANEAAGTITYISSFDFAAAASILDVIVADAEGFFEEVCLDVDIVPGFAPSNGALVAEGQGQMSSAGSFGELIANNVNGDADLVAVAQYGKTAIEALVIPDGGVVDAADLAGTLPGTTMGIKGDVPYSLQATLALLGVERGSFEELLLDGFDPVAHLDLGIDSLPVYKSNEPGQLDAQGVGYTLVDPLDHDVPASFGVFFTSRSFLDDHPTAVQDFVRAALRGFQFGLDDPETAVGHAFDLIDAAGNPLFFSDEGEGFRWLTESAIVVDTTPAGEGIGLLAVDRLGAEIELLTDVGIFEPLPDWQASIDASVVAEVYDGDTLIWPG